MPMTRSWLRGACVVLALVSSARTQAAAQTASSTDDDVKARVEARLVDAGLATVRVDVRHGTVALSGAVESLWQKDQAIRQARKVRDVTLVVSAVAVSRRENDDAIALDIVADVTRSSYFSIFDDVSVRVDGGAATLTGYVTTGNKSEEFAS